MPNDTPLGGKDTTEFLSLIWKANLYPYLRARAYHIAGDRAAKVDPSGLAVEAILQAARHRDQLQDAGNLRAWMTQILVHEVLARLRLAQMRTERLPEGDTLPASDDPVRQAEHNEEKAQLLACLQRLSEPDREVICLKLAGLPHDDIAAALGINPAAARQRYQRAQKRLQSVCNPPQPPRPAP